MTTTTNSLKNGKLARYLIHRRNASGARLNGTISSIATVKESDPPKESLFWPLKSLKGEVGAPDPML
jgi:hypothetical protein